MSVSKDIYNHLLKQLIPQMEVLKVKCEQELKRIIEEKIYSRPESDWYKRTGNFLASVSSTDVIISGNTISFKVYIDPEKLKHFSIAGEESKGISPGEEVYTPPLLNDGHTGLGVNYKATNFLNQYIQELQDDLNHAMKIYIIKKLNRTSYKK